MEGTLPGCYGNCHHPCCENSCKTCTFHDECFKKSIPTVKVHRINHAQVAFRCEKCGHTHLHGWPEGDPRFGPRGHRVGHCDNWPCGYYIEMEEGAQ